MSKSLRVLAALLAYPDARMRDASAEMRELLVDEGAVSPSRRVEIDALMDTLQRCDPLETEAAYVELFDRGRATSLHLFEHVHGDSRDRGPAMIDLGQTYEKAGLVPRSRGTSRLSAGSAGVRVHATAARGARLPRRDRPHPECDLRRACASATAPTPAWWAH